MKKTNKQKQKKPKNPVKWKIKVMKPTLKKYCCTVTFESRSENYHLPAQNLSHIN